VTLTAQGETGRQDAPRNPQSAAAAQDSFAPVIQDEQIRSLVKRFKLLSDETRLRILFYLANTDELHVRALCDLLSQSQPAVSHHLAMLRTAGVVEPRREGKHNFYRLLPGSFDQLLRIVFAEREGDEGLDGDSLASRDGHIADAELPAADAWQRPRPK